MKMKSNEIIVVMVMVVLGVILSLAGFFFLKMSKQETVALRIDEIQDMKGLGYSGQRKVVANGVGEIFVTYRKKYQGKSEIFVAKIFREKKKWQVSGVSSPISVVGTGADQRVPSIAIDARDNLHVVWYGADDDSEKQLNNRQVKYSHSADGGRSWTNWKNIALVDGYDGEDYWQEHPYVLTGAQRELFVAWEGKDENNKNQQIKFSKSFDAGETWSQWENVRETPGNTQSRPTMVLEKNGRIHLLAYSSFGNGGDKQQIVHAWSDNKGDSWSQWELISSHDFDSRHVSAVIDSQEKVHVLWRSMDAKGQAQIMHRFLQGDNWSQTQGVAESKANQFFPSVGVDARGKIFVTWMESEKSSKLPTEDPTDGRVYLSKFSKGGFSKALDISTQPEINLYPNLPEKITTAIPSLLYEAQNSSTDNFLLMLNVLGG